MYDVGMDFIRYTYAIPIKYVVGIDYFSVRLAWGKFVYRLLL